MRPPPQHRVCADALRRSYCKPEDVQRLQYYHGYISIPETDVTAILFGDSQVFLRFSKVRRPPPASRRASQWPACSACWCG